VNSSAAGGLYESEEDRLPLGRFHGHDLTAIVRRRRLRIALGTRHALRIELGEARPVAIEVREEGAIDSEPRRVEVPAIPSPGSQLARRILMLWLASTIVLWIGRRLKAY
jgi:hypothetical protein